MLEIRVTLRVYSKLISLVDLSELLGTPSGGFSIGEVAAGRKPREHTVWMRESTLKRSDRLDAHISQLLDFFEGVRMRLHQAGSECAVDFFCMLSTNDGQGGAEVSVTNLRRPCECDAKLVLDVYGDDARG